MDVRYFVLAVKCDKYKNLLPVTLLTEIWSHCYDYSKSLGSEVFDTGLQDNWEKFEETGLKKSKIL